MYAKYKKIIFEKFALLWSVIDKELWLHFKIIEKKKSKNYVYITVLFLSFLIYAFYLNDDEHDLFYFYYYSIIFK
jgi:hypothetical protein